MPLYKVTCLSSIPLYSFSYYIQNVSQLTVALFFDSLHEKKKQPEGPLVIPALKNKDWRDLARKRKQIYLPPSAAATTGADGSVGGLGTRDTINSGPQLSGLQMSKKPKLEDGIEVKMEVEEQGDVPTTRDASEEAEAKEEELTEDQKAVRAILAAAKNPNLEDEPQIDIIPVSEEDALRQDLTELPDSATLDDYERVPVSQFGAALLRGMGWTDGTAASRKKGADGKPKGLVEPWLPQARPTLLGIGAKEKEVFDDGSGKAGKKFRPDKKYMPLLKVEKNGSSNGSEDRDTRSGSSSRRRSPSPSYSSSKRSSRRSPSPDRRRDRDRYDSDNRRRDDYKNRDRDGERKRDGDRDRDRRRNYESNSSRKDRDRDGDRRRDRSSERHRDSSSRRRDY